MKSIWLYASLSLCLLVGCFQKDASTGVVTLTSKDATPVLLPVRVGGKWGYVNGSGQLAINPQFDKAEEFKEGRAAICIGTPCDSWYDWESSDDSRDDSRWGIIDPSGKIVATPQYREVSSFHEGLAAVCLADCQQKDTKQSSRGYIDRDGKLVIPAQFGIATDFSEGLAQVCIGTCKWEEANKGYSGKFGFIDHSGHFVINPQYDNAGDFKNGFASVTVGKGSDAKRGYVDKTSKVIWQPSN